MSKENLTWQDVYELPLELDSCSSYAWGKSGDGIMALQFKGANKIDRIKIIEAINGGNVKIREDIRNEGCDFYVGDTLIFYVRGWGYLTGTGALNLSEEKALEIQNGFIDHVLKSLSK